MVLRGEGATWNENHLVPTLRNGRMEDVYWTYSYGPIDDEEGANGIGGVLVICTETTEQMVQQQRLAHHHDRFLELFEQAPSFMAVLRGPEHRFEMANPGYIRLAGNRQVVGQTVAEALPEAVQQGYLELLDRVYRTGEAYLAQSARFWLPGADGAPAQERFLDFVYQPIRDAGGAITGIFVEGVDVTERRAAQLQLSRTEQRLRLAMEASLLGTFDVELERGLVSFSSRSQTLFDLDRDVVSLHECFERIPAEEHDLVQTTIHAARAQGQGANYRIRHRVRRRDGTLLWINVVGAVSHHTQPDGSASERLTGVLWDVTEQQALMDELKQSDRRKDAFLATLAHELRNPLAPIRTAAYLLARPGLAMDRVADCAQVIQRQTRTMALLLDDLLEVSRITSGKLELRKAPVSVQAIVDAALEAMRPAIEAKGHALSVKVPEPAPWLEADAVRLSQVLTNLLNNAVKYTDRGGRLSIEVRHHGGDVEIDVVDNGIGLEMQTRPPLFKMFHQIHGQQDRAEGGLGIGLALSRGLVELHGGRLDAYSPGLGHGSTFRVTLPASVATPSGAQAIAAAPAVALQTSRRILVADDNIDAAESMAMLMETEGHEVMLAHDGPAALDTAETHRPDVALLDIGMPGFDGYELAARIRAADWGRNMLLVAMTGWGQRDDRQRALEAGFDVHMTKPVSVEAVMQLLAQRAPQTAAPTAKA